MIKPDKRMHLHYTSQQRQPLTAVTVQLTQDRHSNNFSHTELLFNCSIFSALLQV